MHRTLIKHEPRLMDDEIDNAMHTYQPLQWRNQDLEQDFKGGFVFSQEVHVDNIMIATCSIVEKLCRGKVQHMQHHPAHSTLYLLA